MTGFKLNRDEYQRWETQRKPSELGFQSLAWSDPGQIQEYMKAAKYAPFGKIGGRPVQGAPNLNDVWPNLSWRTVYNRPEYMGEDYQMDLYPGYRGYGPPPKPAFTPFQLQHLRSDFIKDVKFKYCVGQGSLGKVWRVEALLDKNYGMGWDKFRGIKVRRPERFNFAVKVIQHKSLDPTDIDLSFKDMSFLRHLRHRNICNMCDIIGIPDSKTGYPYAIVCLFMEFCHGNFTFFRKMFPLSETLNRHWFAQIISALEYLHRNGVIHSNIRYENILFKKRLNYFRERTFEGKFLECVFKLSDFGKSQQLRVSMAPNNTNDILTLYQILSDNLPGQRNRAMPNTVNWVRNSPAFMDMFRRMSPERPKVLSAFQVMSHRWVLNCTEPRTRPYIYKGKLWQQSIHDLPDSPA